MKVFKIELLNTVGRFLNLAGICAIISVATLTANYPCIAQTPPANPSNLSSDLQNIVKLSDAKISDDVIVGYIKSSGRIYNLSADDISYLEARKMSQPVIQALEQTASPSVPSIQAAETNFSMTAISPTPSQPAIVSAQGINASNGVYENANAIVALCLGVIVLIILLAILGTIFGLKEKVVVYSGKSDLALSFVVPIFIILAFPDFGFDTSVSRTLKVVSLLLLTCSIIQSFVANSSIAKTFVVVPTKFILAGLIAFCALLAVGGAIGGIQRLQKKNRKEAMGQFAVGAAATFAFNKLRKIIARLMRPHSFASASESGDDFKSMNGDTGQPCSDTRDRNNATDERLASEESDASDNYYKILGISPKAKEDEIRNAFRHKMQQYHPDKVAHLGPKLRELAEEESKKINRAYEELLSRYHGNTPAA